MKSLASLEYKKGENKATMDAVWAFILDHADITNEGTLFVKFHTKDKRSFLKSILYRMKGNYRHPDWAEDLLEEKRKNVLKQSLMQSALEQVKKENEKRIKRSRWSKVLGVIKLK